MRFRLIGMVCHGCHLLSLVLARQIHLRNSSSVFRPRTSKNMNKAPSGMNFAGCASGRTPRFFPGQRRSRAPALLAEAGGGVNARDCGRTATRAAPTRQQREHRRRQHPPGPHTSPREPRPPVRARAPRRPLVLQSSRRTNSQTRRRRVSACSCAQAPGARSARAIVVAVRSMKGMIASSATSPPGQLAPRALAPQNIRRELSITPTRTLIAFSAAARAARANGDARGHHHHAAPARGRGETNVRCPPPRLSTMTGTSRPRAARL